MAFKPPVYFVFLNMELPGYVRFDEKRANPVTPSDNTQLAWRTTRCYKRMYAKWEKKVSGLTDQTLPQ